MPFVRHRGASSVLLTHNDLFKSTPVKQVVMNAIVNLSNICRAWYMYLCMDSVMFSFEALGASILWGATISWQLADPFGVHIVDNEM